MSSARARANHHLYLAKIVQDGWRAALAAQGIPGQTLAQAYLPAVSEHLVRAYGWFLLEVTGAEPVPGAPPRGCDELPPVPAGKAVPGEIREFQALERSGWLADMLAERDLSPGAPRTPGNLAAASADIPDPEQVADWTAQLEALFARMR
ncbi:MAG: hypothetical protein KDI01_04565, partial [Halioglobus sp.]|nr:hypothetical protein [Halioglobus sp.]